MHLHSSDKKPSRTTINTVARRFACVILIALLAVGTTALSGCKYTDVLTQHIEDPVNGTLDQNAKPIYKDVSNAKKANRVSTHRGKTKNKDKQKQQKPQYAKKAKSDQKTDKRKQSSDSSHTQAATEGSKPGSDQKKRASTATKSSKQSQQGSAKGKAKSKSKATSSGESSEKGKSKTQSKSKSKQASTGNKAQVYDDGTYQKLPDNVKTVAAAGQYATIVQMISGSDGRHLVAADNAWLSRIKAFGAFKGEGTEKIKVGWRSSDTSQNSSGSAGNARIGTIIKAKPNCVLVDGNDDDSNISTSDRKKLVKAGISVVVVPSLGTPFTSDKDITTAATVVGALLSSSTNGYSKQMAASFVSYHDQIVSKDGDYWYKPGNAYRYQKGQSTAGNAQKNAATTAFVDHIVPANRSTTTGQRMYSPYGGGASDALYLNGKTIDVSDGVGMSLAGSGYALMDYYFQLAAVVDNSYERVQPGSLAYPIVAGQDAKGILSVKAANREAPSALWYAPSEDATVQTVGDDAYPALVARNQTIAKALKASADKTDGAYNVGQKYRIYVMPTGLAGNWADGTVESFLIQPWAAVCLTSSNPSGSDLDSVRNTIQSFYETFYRADATKVSNQFRASLYRPFVATCPR